MKLPIRDMKALGEIAKTVRKTQSLRQDDLGFAAGCSHKFIVDVEKGKRTAQSGLVIDLLAELGIDVYLDVPETAVSALIKAGLVDSTAMDSKNG